MSKVRRHGYSASIATQAMSSPDDGHLMYIRFGQGLISEDELFRIADGLDHLPTGTGFVVGEAVRLLQAISSAKVMAGSVATVLEVYPEIIVIEKGKCRAQVHPSMIEHFPPPEKPRGRKL